MNMRELARLTGQPERQIRYMIAEGFVPSPRGGRANADYGEDHVAAIRRYSVLRQQGFPPNAIRALLDSRLTAPFTVVPGVTLQIDPQLIGGTMDVEALANRVRHVLLDVFKEAPHAHTDSRRAD